MDSVGWLYHKRIMSGGWLVDVLVGSSGPSVSIGLLHIGHWTLGQSHCPTRAPHPLNPPSDATRELQCYRDSAQNRLVHSDKSNSLRKIVPEKSMRQKILVAFLTNPATVVPTMIDPVKSVDRCPSILHSAVVTPLGFAVEVVRNHITEVAQLA